eukprot:5431392-Prymnesium_polylepis.1
MSDLCGRAAPGGPPGCGAAGPRAPAARYHPAGRADPRNALRPVAPLLAPPVRLGCAPATAHLARGRQAAPPGDPCRAERLLRRHLALLVRDGGRLHGAAAARGVRHLLEASAPASRPAAEAACAADRETARRAVHRQLRRSRGGRSTSDRIGGGRPSPDGVVQDVAAFADAALVIAPHSAGLANLAFATEGTPVIEICYDNDNRDSPSHGPGHECPDMYSRLGINLGLPYWVVTGRGVHTSPIVADVDQLRDALSLALQQASDTAQETPRAAEQSLQACEATRARRTPGRRSEPLSTMRPDRTRQPAMVGASKVGARAEAAPMASTAAWPSHVWRVAQTVDLLSFRVQQ